MGLKILAIDPCNVTPYWLDFVRLNHGQISFSNFKVFDEKDLKNLYIEDLNFIFKTLESKYTASVATDNKAILIDDFKHKQRARLEIL